MRTRTLQIPRSAAAPPRSRLARCGIPGISGCSSRAARLTKRHARLDLVDENVRRDRRYRGLVLHLACRDELFWPPCSGGIALRGPFQRLASGFAYVVPAPSLVDRSDTPEAPKRSTAYVCEGDLPLGPAHAPHGEIDTLGRGRFSHFSTYGFIFSTSDNSDPNKNGRTYMAIQP